MTKFIIFMLASFKHSKNWTNILPCSPILPSTAPNIKQNVTKPKTFMLPPVVPSGKYVIIVLL